MKDDKLHLELGNAAIKAIGLLISVQNLPGFWGKQR